jgi:hypothetical protein
MLLEGSDPARASGYRRQGPPPPPLVRRRSNAAARSSDHAASTSRARRELANMRAALLVARELLRCRLAESGHDALLGRVAELLDAACAGTEPFRTPPVSRTPPGACARPHCICSPLQRGPEGSHEGDPAGGVALSTQGASSRSTAGVGGPSGSRDEEPPFARRDQAPGMSGTGAEERQAGFMVMAPGAPTPPPTGSPYEQRGSPHTLSSAVWVSARTRGVGAQRPSGTSNSNARRLQPMPFEHVALTLDRR